CFEIKLLHQLEIQNLSESWQPHNINPLSNMNEASSLLSATCDTFITTLEECVKIANAKFKPEMFPLPHPDPLVSPVSPSPVQMMKRSVSHPGTCTLERSSRFGKEPNVSSHQLSHRWRRTVSDTEPSIDVPFEDTDIHSNRKNICSSGLNGGVLSAL
uniref:Uncharacterized protein n=1 Tax=Pseudonaja textilis TaxID=8673 RepID=A0A670ZJ97_PSETE